MAKHLVYDSIIIDDTKMIGLSDKMKELVRNSPIYIEPETPEQDYIFPEPEKDQDDITVIKKTSENSPHSINTKAPSKAQFKEGDLDPLKMTDEQLNLFKDAPKISDVTEWVEWGLTPHTVDEIREKCLTDFNNVCFII